MEPQMTPIIPIAQVLISFAGHNFLAVQLHGGRIAVVFTHFCEALDLDRWGQVKRIQANPTLAKNFLLVRIQTPGGPQVVNALVVSVLTLWLGGFDLTRLSEEQRRLIILLQEDAEEAFSRPFIVTPIEPPQQPKSQQATQSGRNGQSEPLPLLPEMLRAMADRVEQDQREGAARHTDIERRVSVLEEERAAMWATITDYAPASPDALTADHQRMLHLLLRNCHVITRRPIADLEQELAALLGVEGILHIPEAAWDRLFAWFWQRTL